VIKSVQRRRGSSRSERQLKPSHCCIRGNHQPVVAANGTRRKERIDGAPRTYRDRKDYAMEAARLIKSKNPHSTVEVKDLYSVT
jgi:hypothetical protein